MVNKKALAIFLSLTFGLTLGLVIIAKLRGFTLVGAPDMYAQLTLLAAMFIPAISALVCQKFILKKPLLTLGFSWGPWRWYARTYVVVVLVFVVNYALTWLLFAKPDFSLRSFMGQYPGMDAALPFPAWQMTLIFTFITLVTAPLFNMIPSLGEEIGWRGFLLPVLEPLGRVKAMVISGAVWALWHTPFILILGFGYGSHRIGAVLHFLAVASIGIWMGDLWFRTRSTVLAAFIHAVFNANAYGIWTMLFISRNKLLVGPVSVTGTVLLMIIAGLTLRKYLSNPGAAPAAELARPAA